VIQDDKVPQKRDQQSTERGQYLKEGFRLQKISPTAPQPKDNQKKGKRNKPAIAIRLWRSCRRRKHGATRPSGWERATVWLTAVIALCTGVQALIYWQQKGIMEFSSRPYVGLAVISSAYNEQANAMDVSATIDNFGTTPAFDFSGTWTGTINGKAMPGFGQAQQPYVLPPKRSVGLQARFSKNDWDRIDSGQDRLILKVVISYRFSKNSSLVTECEEDEYYPLAKAFFPGGCEN